MKKLHYSIMLALFFMAALTPTANAQGGKVQPSQKAMVTQYVGNDAMIAITYSRPGIKGRTVWGELVPWGMQEGNKYSDNKPFPWRAGANENTTIEFNKDVKVEGQALPAGKYSIHMIPAESGQWTVIFNKKNDQWGSYKYDDSADALRVMVTPKKASKEEWLSYGFDDITEDSAVAYLHWDELMVPFKISI
ncbi:MAG: hypothetical protein CL868_14450 [Cytophagaceae bacterium]|nr:hypothetical protein [Cytophagaceae bacterium]